LKKIYFKKKNIYFQSFEKNKTFFFLNMMRFSLQKLIEFLFILKAILYSFKRNKIFIIFKNQNYPFKLLYYLSKKNQIINLPHGFPPWDGPKDKVDQKTTQQINLNHPIVNSAIYPGHKNFEWFYFFNLKISKLSREIESKKQIFPLRYTREWTNLLKKEIFDKKDSFNVKKRKIITYFAQKDPSSDNHFTNYQLEKAMLMHIAKNYKDIKLNIRLHPSQLVTSNNSFIKDLEKHDNCKIHIGESTSTFELINNSDLVMGTFTTALLDAISLNKEIIILKHLTKINCILDINTTHDHDNFKNIFNNVMKKLQDRKQVSHEKIYSKLIFPKDYQGQDVFNFYLEKVFN
tara:strand:+ start:415 stop:1455 length:1041 start_codon:yes stop_codon:yes gene_type:complete